VLDRDLRGLVSGRTDGVIMIGHYPWRTDLEPPPAPSDEELQSIWSAEVFE
jgi:hypothetical protein